MWCKFQQNSQHIFWYTNVKYLSCKTKFPIWESVYKSVGQSIFTSACLLHSLSLKLYPFHIFHPFPTQNYFLFSMKYFQIHFHTIAIISNIFLINQIISIHFPFKYFDSTFIPIKLYILYILHPFSHYTYRL